MVDQDEFLLQELADTTGVSQRTIRYYTQEGLLPEPEIRGKYAYYTQEHLDRLRLILQLKETYLPLREIRQLLLSLSWPEVRDYLQGKSPADGAQKRTPAGETNPQPAPVDYSQQPPAPGLRVAEPESALDYITRLLDKRSELGMPDPQHAPASPLPARRSPAQPPAKPPAAAGPTRPADSLQQAAPTPPESWRRFVLAPGVELHIKEPTAARDYPQIEALIQFARQLFSREKK